MFLAFHHRRYRKVQMSTGLHSDADQLGELGKYLLLEHHMIFDSLGTCLRLRHLRFIDICVLARRLAAGVHGSYSFTA